jgi:hypothetical protein
MEAMIYIVMYSQFNYLSIVNSVQKIIIALSTFKSSFMIFWQVGIVRVRTKLKNKRTNCISSSRSNHKLSGVLHPPPL